MGGGGSVSQENDNNERRRVGGEWMTDPDLIGTSARITLARAT